MTYQEVHDIAYAIGYHRGRMRLIQDLDAIETDVAAFAAFLDRVPKGWVPVAIRAHDDGITAGDTGPPAPKRKTRGRRV